MLKSWDAGTRRPLAERSLDGLGAIRLAPGGQSLAAVENHGVRLLDVASHEPLPGGYLPHPMPVLDVAFSPGGDRILTAQGDGSAQLWDAATRKPLVPPAVLIGSTRGVAFTPDGGTCLAVASDGTIRRWPVPGPIEEPDLARLADRVALMTGQRMGAGQGLDYLPPPEEWRSLRARLVGEGSTALVPPMAEDDWLDARAADAEQDCDAIGARWHLDRLAALRPGEWMVPARLGRILAATGDRAGRTRRTRRPAASTPRPGHSAVGSSPPPRTM